MTKRCADCKETKPLDEFGDRTGPNGKVYKQPYCRPCSAQRSREWTRANPRRAWNNSLRKYDIDSDDYERMFKEQGGRCAICNTEDPGGNKKVKRFPVDHDHGTGEVRGLLCTPCNTALGKFKDDVDILLSAVAYLQGRKNENSAFDSRVQREAPGPEAKRGRAGPFHKGSWARRACSRLWSLGFGRYTQQPQPC